MGFYNLYGVMRVGTAGRLIAYSVPVPDKTSEVSCDSLQNEDYRLLEHYGVLIDN
jgi:hypothetical protein